MKGIAQRFLTQDRLKYLISFSFLLLTSSACTTQRQNTTPVQTAPPTEIASSTEIPFLDNKVTLDLEEANVTAVSFEIREDGNYRFDVTLQHDDEGEAPNYADFWQVEDLDGNVLGKRVLTHSHSNEPFTRSETISIPEGISQVLVRGHDMNHGFGGQAMRVDLLSGETERFVESGNEE